MAPGSVSITGALAPNPSSLRVVGAVSWAHAPFQTVSFSRVIDVWIAPFGDQDSDERRTTIVT